MEQILSRLTLTDYQALSTETAVYPGKGTLVGLLYVALGLGEAGEVQGKIKKVLRDDFHEEDITEIGLLATSAIVTPEKKEQIKAELGDLLWYLANTAEEAGLDLEDIARGNLDKLNSRKERGVLGGSGDNR